MPVILPPFDRGLAETFRKEADAMAAAYTEALLETAPPDSIAGIYAKGSICKAWDSLIDYVPEVSDVDIHVRFVDTAAARLTLGTVERSIAVARRAASSFGSRVIQPAHAPRPQLMVLNELEQLQGYLASPESTVRTLYGQPYAAGSTGGYAHAVADDLRRLLSDADFVELELPQKLVDRPGPLAWQVVRLLTWRIGPAGPRLLTQLGVEPYSAWSLNRTAVARELAARVGDSIAEAYASFYRAGWAGFRSRFQDGAAAISAVLAAATFYHEARALLADER